MSDFQTQLRNRVCYSLNGAKNALSRKLSSRLSQLGLTFPHYLALSALWQQDGLTSSTIAIHLGTSPNAITPLADRLEAAGLVRRERASEDRRIVYLRLTEKGKHLRSAVNSALATMDEQMLHDADRLGRLCGELDALARRMLDHDDDSRLRRKAAALEPD